MKRQIRRCVFETNSSSTHAINIYRGCDYNIPKEIHIKGGEFGWECTKYNSPEDKLAYLYQYCINKCNIWELNDITNHWECHQDYKKLKDYQYRIKTMLEDAGVEEVIFDEYVDGYIDHCESLGDCFEDVLDNFFIDFIFNPRSYIETGNDNDDKEVFEDYGADWTYYKSN